MSYKPGLEIIHVLELRQIAVQHESTGGLCRFVYHPYLINQQPNRHMQKNNHSSPEDISFLRHPPEPPQGVLDTRPPQYHSRSVKRHSRGRRGGTTSVSAKTL